MALEELTSLQLHLDFPAAQVVETRRLTDSACGCHPCYYRVVGDRLLASTSAAALIVQGGTLDLNPDFRPPDYLGGGGLQPRGLFVRVTGALPLVWKDHLKRWLPEPLFKRWARNRYWYESWETMDRRVRKLRPFETVTPNGASNRFAPDFTQTDPAALVEGVAQALAAFVHEMEDRFPDHEHWLLLGGKDSQLIALVPKLRPQQWRVFSAEPNAELNRRWLEENDLGSLPMHRHDNHNEETPEDTRWKIICGDLYADPRHVRWLPALRQIAVAAEQRCIFWAGTAPCGLHEGRRYYRRYRGGRRAAFFDTHLTRVPSLMGNYHQVVKNFTGCALVSPYQTAAIWRDVYMHYGPDALPLGVDLRERIGERLAGRPIRWLRRNPGPAPYQYRERLDVRAVYLNYLRARLAGEAG